jgi:hypothetical protein
MILKTYVNSRPALATYMNAKFEPVDDENLATVVEVIFTDEQNGTIFLVPKSHTAIKTQAEHLLRDYDPNEPRDEEGRWTSGGDADKPAAEKPSGGGKKKTDVADFAKDNIGLEGSTRTDPEKQKKFIESWNSHIGEAPAEFRNEFLGGLKGTMNVYYEDSSDQMTVRGALQDENGSKIGEYTRTIDFENNKAESDYFKLNAGKQHANVGKQILAANMAMYQKLGLDELEVHANIDVGGYAWAKYGYVPTDQSWRNLSTEIEQKIDELSSGGSSGYTAGSWDELSEHDQDRIQNAWLESTRDEFYDSEVDSWRDSGQPLAP